VRDHLKHYCSLHFLCLLNTITLKIFLHLESQTHKTGISPKRIFMWYFVIGKSKCKREAPLIQGQLAPSYGWEKLYFLKYFLTQIHSLFKPIKTARIYLITFSFSFSLNNNYWVFIFNWHIILKYAYGLQCDIFIDISHVS
jgi:hypothetical protein